MTLKQKKAAYESRRHAVAEKNAKTEFGGYRVCRICFRVIPQAAQNLVSWDAEKKAKTELLASPISEPASSTLLSVSAEC